MKIYKKIILFLIIAVLNSYASSIKFSYEINFIDDLLRTTEGVEKVEALFQKARYEMTRKENFESGIEYLLKARDLSKELDHFEGTAKALDMLGDIYQSASNYSTALDYFKRELKILKDKGELNQILTLLHKMADVKINAKDFDDAIDILEEILSFSEESADKNIIASANYYLSLAYRGKFDYKTALKYTKTARSIAEETENYHIISNSYNAVGDLNEMMGNYDIAFKNYKKALDLYESYKNPAGLTVAYFNLANMYKVKGDYTTSLEFFNKSLDLAFSMNYRSMIEENYIGLYGIYNLLKDFNTANQYYMLLNSYNSKDESISAPISKIEIEYELSKKEIETELLNLRLDKEKNIRYIYAGLFLFILTTTYFLFYHKLKQRKIYELKIEEKRVRAELSSLQSKINPHFLFNALSSTSELIEIEPSSAKKMLQNISSLMRYALRTSKNEFVHLEEEILIIKKYLEIEKIRFGKRLEYKIGIPENLLNILIPPLLIQPLVENSIKHGISNKLQDGVVSVVSFEKIPGRVTIIVEDNGENIKQGSKKPDGQGFGVSSVRERLLLTYGNDHLMKIEKENGYKVTIVIPKKT